MAGSLSHSPADIIRYLLINLSVGIEPGGVGDWPIFADTEPSLPDNCITVYNTTPVLHGRTMYDGQTQKHHGIMVKVRAKDTPTGYAKANAVAVALEGAYQSAVTIGASSYLVHCVNLASGPIHIGTDPESNRELYTINFLSPIRLSQ